MRREDTEGGGREILFKIIVVGYFIFSSKCTRKRLATGLRLEPFGELERSHRPLATVGDHREEIKSSHSLTAVRCAKRREGRQKE